MRGAKKERGQRRTSYQRSTVDALHDEEEKVGKCVVFSNNHTKHHHKTAHNPCTKLRLTLAPTSYVVANVIKRKLPTAIYAPTFQSECGFAARQTYFHTTR